MNESNPQRPLLASGRSTCGCLDGWGHGGGWSSHALFEALLIATFVLGEAEGDTKAGKRFEDPPQCADVGAGAARAG